MSSFKVDDSHRVNPLSFEEGGVTVCAEINGKVLEYDKVKYPKKFIDKLIKNNPGAKAWVKK
jgi:hypothetical protein